MTALHIDKVACARGGRVLFEGLSLALSAGQAALVTGPNGAGKSSLLRLIAGLLEAASGSVRVDGRIALANDDLALDRHLPLERSLEFWAKLDGSASVTDVLLALDMGHLADVPVRILSTGQRKRAVLARTLASGTDIWLLDEPANGLDTASLHRLGEAMAAHRAGGGIVVAASHQPLDLPDAQTLVLG